MVDTVAINDKFALGMRAGPVFQTTIIPLARAATRTATRTGNRAVEI
jgi:hypothetical protein